MILEVQELSFSYEKKQILDRLSFSLKRGEALAIMGPSGCGKSTLLNLIAGLRKPSGGTIRSNAERITYMFQEPRLFPWLNLEENLRAVADKSTTPSDIANALQKVGLSGCEKLYPSALSGGMKSRAALARALIHDGDLFLLDEPFAALDEELRVELGEILRKHLQEKGASMILVTHQASDAQALTDRILRLSPLNQ